MPPKIAVVVTCYNLGRYLDEAIASVEAQTWRDFEIRIVDDGSDEPATLATLQRLAVSGIAVTRTENSGLPAARNQGVRHTTGEFICCLDADDRLHPSWLEKAVAALDADPSLAFVSHWVRAFGDEQWDWKPSRCDLAAVLDFNTINGAAAVRRTIWDAVGGQDETLRQGCEDWDFWITVLERGHPGVILPEFLFEYRRRKDSMSGTWDAEAKLRLYEQVMARHAESFARLIPEIWRQRQFSQARAIREAESLECEWQQWLERRWNERRRELDVLLRLAEQRRRLDQATTTGDG